MLTLHSNELFLPRPDPADISIRLRQRETSNTTVARDDLRWASSTDGTVLSRSDILGTVAPGDRSITVPDVCSGGESLSCRSCWPRVEKALQTIAAVEAPGIGPAGVTARICAMSTIGCPSVRDHNPTRTDAIAPGNDGST
jgi:hypothetical protein